MSSYHNTMLAHFHDTDTPVLVDFDYYALANALSCSEEIKHSIKKLMAVGIRNGGKSALQDLAECLDQIHREIKRIKDLEKVS